MITEAIALPYVAMQAHASKMPEAGRGQRLISVIEPGVGKRIFAEDSERILTLFFDEVSPCMWESAAEFEQVLRDFRARGREFVVFDERQADSIIDFLLRAQACHEPERLYVNCSAGIARSGAIVQFVAAVLDLDEALFRKLNQGIAPNEHVLAMLHKRWREKGLSAPGAPLIESGAHCPCGHVYDPQHG